MLFGPSVESDGVRFKLWAPSAKKIDLRLHRNSGTRDLAMEALPEAWFEIHVKDAGPGSRYQFVIDGDLATPDPAARYQPGDVHGQSEVVDPESYRWQCSDWRGRPWHETVFYELHVGSFSEAGTFANVEHKLDYLVDLGVTAIELMPVADFPGTRNWGYDGVLHFAPDAQYGTPDELKRLIDSAHAKGLMVFLDVVYNHFGPDGNYLHVYAREFFTDRHQTPWGAAIDFERKEVRQFFIENVLYWINEFRFDGLRFDAVHAIIDEKSPNILEEIAQEVYAHTDPGRHIHLVLENDNNEARYLERRENGAPSKYVAQWNDDIHHVYHVIATGETDGYYEDYTDDPVGRLGRCLTEGFAYQGEVSKHRDGIARGEKSSHLPPTAFVNFQQNHDQIGNRAFGERLVKLSATNALKALSAIALIAPSPPMLFMGEEWGASTPFLFFCDFGEELGNAVREGRKREFSKFTLFEAGSAAVDIPDPTAKETFERSCLDWNEVTLPQHAEWMAHYKGLLHVRKSEITPRLTISTPNAVSLDRIGKTCLSLSWTLNDKQKLTLLTNLGPESVALNARKTEGRTLWSSHPDLTNDTETETIPAWFVLWTLQ